MKILVFGAGGYIGIPLCERLLMLGHDVYGVDRWFFEQKPALNQLGRLITGDIRTFSFGHPALKATTIDVVVDLAGLSNDASSEIDERLTYEINTDGARRVARAAKAAGVKRYIYSSSASVYGGNQKHLLTEESATMPLTAYAVSKLKVEEELQSLAGEKFHPVILRNATVFGYAPRMRFDLAVNVMTMRAITDKRILIMGGGKQYRPFVHVSDVVDAICLGINLPIEQVSGQIFNVGDNNMNYQIKDLALMVQSVFNNAEIIEIPDGDDKRSYHVSFNKIRRLGFFAIHDIRRGIEEVADAILTGQVDPKDPRTVTLWWYKSLMEWDKRLHDMRFDGRIL